MLNSLDISVLPLTQDWASQDKTNTAKIGGRIALMPGIERKS